jgi:hypothetical protein
MSKCSTSAGPKLLVQRDRRVVTVVGLHVDNGSMKVRAAARQPWERLSTMRRIIASRWQAPEARLAPIAP